MLDEMKMDVVAELQKPLDPKHVKPAPAGKYGDYVDGYHVVSEANRIFGNLGWSYEIKSLKGCGVWQTTGKSGAPQVKVSYMCIVRAWVGDTVREGSAVGHGYAKPEQEGDAHESAVKEAETDALKRALRTLGNTFGLALYDKSENRENVKDPRSASEILRDEIKADLAKTPKRVSREAIRHHDVFSGKYNQLDLPHQAEIDALLKGFAD